VEESA
jgi:hypothetical protein